MICLTREENIICIYVRILHLGTYTKPKCVSVNITRHVYLASANKTLFREVIKCLYFLFIHARTHAHAHTCIRIIFFFSSDANTRARTRTKYKEAFFLSVFFILLFFFFFCSLNFRVTCVGNC